MYDDPFLVALCAVSNKTGMESVFTTDTKILCFLTDSPSKSMKLISFLESLKNVMLQLGDSPHPSPPHLAPLPLLPTDLDIVWFYRDLHHYMIGLEKSVGIALNLY